MKCTYQGLDYRKMPQSALNSNIPQGRGMIKWAPFKTMPEQYEKIDQMIEEQAHVLEPSLNNDQLQEIEISLRDSVGKVLVLRYWDAGYEVQIECRLENIDNWSQMIVVSKSKELININFTNIYEVVRISDDNLYSTD